MSRRVYIDVDMERAYLLEHDRAFTVKASHISSMFISESHLNGINIPLIEPVSHSDIFQFEN